MKFMGKCVLSVMYLVFTQIQNKCSYRVEGEGGGQVAGAGIDAPLAVRGRLQALLRRLAKQRVELLPLPYHLPVKETLTRDRLDRFFSYELL
jgi:hypothetical protein